MDGTTARASIDELRQGLAHRQAEIQALQKRLKQAVEITPDKQDEFATFMSDIMIYRPNFVNLTNSATIRPWKLDRTSSIPGVVLPGIRFWNGGERT